MGHAKPHRETLRSDWAESLLSAPDPTYPDARSVAERLEAAREELRGAVELARDVIEKNPLTPTVAQAAARAIGRRGQPHILVDDGGVVLLEITYGQKAEAEDSDKRGWTSVLPSLKELRERAEKVGLDPKPFGRRRRELLQTIEAEEGKHKNPQRKMRKTAPAIGPVTIIKPTPEADAAPKPNTDLPFDDPVLPDDLTEPAPTPEPEAEAPAEEPTNGKPTPEPSEDEKEGDDKPDLRQIVDDADELNIDEILDFGNEDDGDEDDGSDG